MKKYYLLLIIFFTLTSMTSDKPAYRLFDKTGKITSYDNLLKAALNADIVLFGELHNNPICHWLEKELAEDIFKSKAKQLVIGAEMFETDNQLIIDEFMSDKIKESNFEAKAKLWNNYKTDYKPLLNFAKKNKIPFIATNIPRRYASMVNRGGFEVLDSLNADAKRLLPPLPVKYNPELQCYKQMISNMGNSPMGGHSNSNLPKAQAVKDATMAYNIIKNWNKGKIFIHYHGTYHSDNYESIYWYLKQLNPNIKILTISSIEQNSIDILEKESINKADYILCIPESMTKTY